MALVLGSLKSCVTEFPFRVPLGAPLGVLAKSCFRMFVINSSAFLGYRNGFSLERHPDVELGCCAITQERDWSDTKPTTLEDWLRCPPASFAERRKRHCLASSDRLGFRVYRI